ncbi:sulfite exporter TauE/SafE family protein [Muricoccus vinaceus]|uniref:Probable membrane transporter protein n=1 Tax=Muricoccus vinaceus TaxID=424704 RepID=A0ABV6J2E9_9PROT
MSSLLMASIGAAVVATSFLSGVFGMAGGLILVGVLLALLPLPAAMTLHAVTQIASNFWRGLLWWRHIRWSAALPFNIGAGVMVGAWSLLGWVPDKAVAILMLGLSPFLVRLLPSGLRPDPSRAWDGVACGAASMALMLGTGVSGPLVDMFFLGGKLDRREIVATKAVCQVLGHGAKLAYFGMIISDPAGLDPEVAILAVASSMVGTSAARRLLEAMTDLQFRRWANRLITVLGCYYVVQGAVLLSIR